MVHRMDHVQRLCARMTVYLCQIKDERVGHTVIVKDCARLIDRPVYQHSSSRLDTRPALVRKRSSSAKLAPPIALHIRW